MGGPIVTKISAFQKFWSMCLCTMKYHGMCLKFKHNINLLPWVHNLYAWSKTNLGFSSIFPSLSFLLNFCFLLFFLLSIYSFLIQHNLKIVSLLSTPSSSSPPFVPFGSTPFLSFVRKEQDPMRQTNIE